MDRWDGNAKLTRSGSILVAGGDSIVHIAGDGQQNKFLAK
jgi:hypothetical protein